MGAVLHRRALFSCFAWLAAATPTAVLAQAQPARPGEVLTETAGKAQVIAPVDARVAAAERAFIDFLDATGAVGYIESGGAQRHADRNGLAWARIRDSHRQQLDAALASIPDELRDASDRLAVAAMHKSLEALDSSSTTTGSRKLKCADAQRPNLDYGEARTALVACFIEHGNQLLFEQRFIDRGTALQLLHVVDAPGRRKALFDAFRPLWTALNGANEADSPYRRMIAMAASDAKSHGSQIDAAARAIGVSTAEVERWLVQILSAWRDANPSPPIEPWDYRYNNSAANRALQARMPAGDLLPITRRFYRDLGADLDALHVVFDLAPRVDKSPLAYTDFLSRGRLVDGKWQRPVARVVGTFPDAGLFALNELVHENGHAVHVGAIRTRPAFMDWPDTLFTEAFADVPSWSVYEPAWQRRYLGTAVPESVAMRALFGDVMLDVAWSLFELRLLRDPTADPNAVWTGITRDYLHIVPHPELPWWAMRVQLAGDPGYMVNYGLGAVLTAEMRAEAIETGNRFDAGNAGWHEWASGRLLQFGSSRDTVVLMQGLLGRPVSPGALLDQVKRCSARP